MGDGTSHISNATAVTQSGASQRLYGSDSVRQVRGRALLQPGEQSVEEQIGLERLKRAFQSGEQLNPEAPRGYYLNIRV